MALSAGAFADADAAARSRSLRRVDEGLGVATRKQVDGFTAFVAFA
jgi:hypothetical protein